MSAAGAGEAAGFEWLFETFGRRVHGFVRSRGLADPDDITSEVFASAFRSLNSFSGTEEQFASWLFQIARNRVIDDARKRARRPQINDGDAPVDLPADIDVETLVLGSGEQDWLRAVLDRLTDDQREVLVLRFVADLSLEQTAEVMGRNPNAVKALQHRAIGAVHRILSAEAVTR